MTIETASLSKSLADLRRDFDNTFAAPPRAAGGSRESLILLRVAREALAVRTLHITGVAKRTRLMPVSSRVPSLLGITAIRGALLPVYDLAALLELPGAAGEGSWLMLTNPETPIALVFDEFEGQVEIEQSYLHESGDSGFRKHLRPMPGTGAAHRAVIDIPGIVEEIRKTARVPEPAEEYTK